MPRKVLNAVLLLAGLAASVSAVVGCGSQGPVGSGSASVQVPLNTAKAAAAASFNSGNYVSAAEQWKRLAALAASPSQAPVRVDALINLGSSYEMLGQYDMAKATLDEALDGAEALQDRRRIIAGLNVLGVACTLKPDAPLPAAPADAGHQHGAAAAPAHVHGGSAPHRDHSVPALLGLALKLAAGERQSPAMLRLEASIHDNLGNYLTDAKNFQDATAEYHACEQLAEKLKDPALAAKGAANAAACCVAAVRFYDQEAARAAASTRKRIRDTAAALRQQATDAAAEGQRYVASVLSHAQAMPATSLKAFLLVQTGQTAQQLSVRLTDPTPLERDAEGAYSDAAAVASACGDSLSLSYALGYLGHVFEVRKQEEPALALTRRAVFAAQKAQSPDALYRWQWQLGRLLNQAGQRDSAVASYQQAVETVKGIRNDIALGNGNQRNRASFREDVGQMYFQLADLLLQKSSTTANALDAEKILVSARSTLESLKSAELEDYLHDDCVQLYKAHNTGDALQDIKVDGTAVVYIVPLDDRIELLIQVRAHLYERRSDHSRKELDATVTEFRKMLPYVATSEYKTSGAKLYDWLIAPLEPLLKQNKIDTLVFVPDGLLRTVPMAALYNENTREHLIERYAVAVVPGLDLVDSSQSVGEHLQSALLVTGLSQPRGEFPPLPYVPIELTNVQRNFHADSSQELLNGSFVLSNLRTQIRSKRFTVVHIASHGHFGADASKTFILTFDDKAPLTLDELEKLIRPQQFDPNGKPQPVDLLVLSCCQTAAGDDRAALGLAGVAVKSGARSAVATLWSVNDQSSTLLVSEFYRDLATPTSLGQAQLSKAKALQEAQKAMLLGENVVYRHPYIWAPYMIIGNWQ